MNVKPVVVLVAVIGAASIAGCGSSGNDEEEEGSAAVVSVGKVASVGRVLVNSKGLTLYRSHDDKGAESTCYAVCAESWPPLTTSGSPQAEGGAIASKLGTTERKDGTIQVTYAGHPLYTFTADTKPGDRIGNGVNWSGAERYAVKPSGRDAVFKF